MKIGDIVYGKVTNILGYGAFVVVDDYDGLIHISEFSDHFVRDIKDFVNIQEELERISLTVDSLKLWSEQMLANGVIDKEKYLEYKNK